MQIQADRHNFGKCVQRIERASGTWFQKPRSVHWEWLFFGKTSPLAELFSECGSNGIEPLGKYLFNLAVEPVHDWLGFSKEVLATNVDPAPEHFYAFGVLIAYCYIFGIRDLHKFNLVMTPTHLQVVDVEVVLAKLIIPNETILLPFKDISWALSGINCLATNPAQLTEEQTTRLFAGYIDLFELVAKKQGAIKQTLKSHVRTSAPIRMILRNTVIYRDYLAGKMPNIDMLPEEKVQLERGDIPYFFKKIGDDHLYWVSNDRHYFSTVTSLGKFMTDVHRHAMFEEEMFSIPSFKLKMANGLALLQKKLEPKHKLNFKFNSGPITFADGKMALRTQL